MYGICKISNVLSLHCLMHAWGWGCMYGVGLITDAAGYVVEEFAGIKL